LVKRRSRRRKTSSRERSRREEPTVMTAAGLLAFYEEAEAIVNLKPYWVLGIAIGFSVLIVLLTLLHPIA